MGGKACAIATKELRASYQEVEEGRESEEYGNCDSDGRFKTRAGICKDASWRAGHITSNNRQGEVAREDKYHHHLNEVEEASDDVVATN